MGEILKLLVPIIAAHVVVLGVLILVIKRLLVSDTRKAEARIKQVEVELRKKEEAVRREIEEHEKELTRRKTDMEEELQRRRDDSEREAVRLREQVVSEAKRDGDRIITAAKKNEQRMREQLEQGVAERAVEFGGEVFRMVMSEQATAQLNRQLVGEVLDELEQIDAGSISVDGTEAEISSSRPLDADQRERLRGFIVDKLHVHAQFKELVVPEMIAGLKLKLGSLEIDASLLNRYREAILEVKKTAGL